VRGEGGDKRKIKFIDAVQKPSSIDGVKQKNSRLAPWEMIYAPRVETVIASAKK